MSDEKMHHWAREMELDPAISADGIRIAIGTVLGLGLAGSVVSLALQSWFELVVYYAFKWMKEEGNKGGMILGAGQRCTTSTTQLPPSGIYVSQQPFPPAMPTQPPGVLTQPPQQESFYPPPKYEV